MCIFIVLGERPCGVQIEQYSLRNKEVQQRIPLLVAIHCAFLTSIFLGETIWFSIKPDLPSYWFTESGKRGGPLYVTVVIGGVTVLFFAQVIISRRILSRGLRERLNDSGSVPSAIDKLSNRTRW